MKKTSVYLDEAAGARLKGLAEREGRSEAQIIRDAIQQYEEKTLKRRRFAMAGVGEGPGDSVADIPEEELLRGFGS